MKNKPTLLPWILFALVTLVFIYIRLRLINLPLERDEGEYAYGGQLILSGSPPYLDIYNMKFPGVYYCYSLFILLFGNTIMAIRLGGLIVNILTAFLLFKTAELLRNRTAAVYTAIGFIALSASPRFLGLSVNTEHFVNLFVALAAYFLVRWAKERGTVLLLLTGLASGLACVMKQHGSYFLPVAMAAIIMGNPFTYRNVSKGVKNIFILCSGFLFVILLMLASLWLTGTFHRFIFLTVKYGNSYIAYKSFLHEFPVFFIALTGRVVNNHIMWLSILAGIFLSYRILPRYAFRLLLTWVVFSCAAIFPGYYFRPHYYLYILPVSAIYFGLLFDWLFEWGALQLNFKRYIPIFLFTGCFTYLLIGERQVFFLMNSNEILDNLYGIDHYLFNEAADISEYIQQHTSKNDRVLIVGSEPEIYFYSRRRAASAYIYEYPLIEPQPLKDSMRNEFISQAINSNPVIIINCRGSMYDESFHKWVLNDKMHINSAYDLKGYGHRDGTNKNVFVWNNNETGIPDYEIMWEIYEKRAQ